MGIFTATFSAIAVSAAQDVFEIVAPSNSRVAIRRILLGQYTLDEETIAESDLVGVQIIRGYTTTGSGGAAVNAKNIDEYGPDDNCTIARNNDTLATAGSPFILVSEAWNVMGGYVWPTTFPPSILYPNKTGLIIIKPSTRLVVRIIAPKASMTMNGTLEFEELGQGGA